jgi:hypothetical protein
VWIIQRSGRLRLTNKPLYSISVSSNIGWKNLQRHSAIEFGVLGQVDLTHSAGT